MVLQESPWGFSLAQTLVNRLKALGMGQNLGFSTTRARELGLAARALARFSSHRRSDVDVGVYVVTDE